MQRDQLVVLRDLINVVLASDPLEECCKVATTTDPDNWASDGHHWQDIDAETFTWLVDDVLMVKPMDEIDGSDQKQAPQEEEAES